MILKFLFSGFHSNCNSIRADLGFMKGEAYSSSRSLKQGIWGCSPPEAIILIGLLHI